jgi:hypothetical protein
MRDLLLRVGRHPSSQQGGVAHSAVQDLVFYHRLLGMLGVHPSFPGCVPAVWVRILGLMSVDE